MTNFWFPGPACLLKHGTIESASSRFGPPSGQWGQHNLARKPSWRGQSMCCVPEQSKSKCNRTLRAMGLWAVGRRCVLPKLILSSSVVTACRACPRPKPANHSLALIHHQSLQTNQPANRPVLGVLLLAKLLPSMRGSLCSSGNSLQHVPSSPVLLGSCPIASRGTDQPACVHLPV